jgi:isocitrate dehydrogenase
MQQKTPITVAYGDGIGPEIMRATLAILEAAGARVATEVIEIGERVYLSGNSAGIAKSSWESLRRTKIFLKAPITTPSGGGYKSLNVTVRKTLGLYANVRPCVSYAPFVDTLHPKIDVVIVRENEEDLYAGIEHRQTHDVYQCLKLISRPGCEKIIRYAFEYARQHGRKKVTCMTKDNIMKMSDGLFHKVFDEMALDYPELTTEHMIIDIGTARMAARPAQFDVVVTPNLYGDILSDVAAELTGSVGLAGSANIGDHVAMFEAIHGSAPDIAGKGLANPSGLLHGAVMMLQHIGQHEVAARIHNAWLCAIEEGAHTADIAAKNDPTVLTTSEFTDAVIARLGARPTTLKPVEYAAATLATLASPPVAKASSYQPPHKAIKTLVGVDVFFHWQAGGPDALAATVVNATNHAPFELQMITNRGVKVWPEGFPETFCTDHWRCRFMAVTAEGEPCAGTHEAIIQLLALIRASGLDFIKTENLYTFDGEPGFALGQGQ